MTLEMNEVIAYVVTSGEEYPNVTRINIPSDHREDGAAWIYVPSKGPHGTIFIGPPGSHYEGGSIELAATIKRYVDVKKGEKLISGVLYDDGYVDYFQATDDTEADNLTGALYDYHEAYYNGNGAFTGETKQRDNGFSSYPTEDDTAFDPEDEHGDDDDPIYDPDTNEQIGWLPRSDRGQNIPTLDDVPDDSSWSWLKNRDWSGTSGYETMKTTQGHNMGPIQDWTPENHLAWRDRADQDRGHNGGWSSREDLAHFRWSFGDDSLVKGAPHQGLWFWPTEHAYPDHHSQTGNDGLGNCAQGRVYPHGDKWEILTWPNRPRHIRNEEIRAKIKAEAQAAVKDYLVTRIGIDPKDIFFTEMFYNDAVSNYDSEYYPGRPKYKVKPITPAKDDDGYDWDTGGNGMYTNYADSPSGYVGPKTPLFDENGDAIYRTPGPSGSIHRNFIPDEYMDRLSVTPAGSYEATLKGWVPNEPGYFDSKRMKWVPDAKAQDASTPGILNKVLDKIKNQGQTPEDRWQETIEQHDAYQRAKQERIDAALREHAPHLLPENQETPTQVTDAPEGTSQVTAGDAEYMLHKKNGAVTVVSKEDYELAVEEYGEENWFLAFMEDSPKDQVTSIQKGATNIHDLDPENYLQQIKSMPQPTKSTQTWDKADIQREAFVWLGFGYGPDAGNGDPKDAELITGNAHWNIVGRLLGKNIQTISEFMFAAKNGEINVPMVWGWATTSPKLPGVYVQFLSHLMDGFQQDLNYVPMALGAVAKHYNKPIEDYDTEESSTPILESHPVSGGGIPPDPLATAPTPSGAGQRSIDLSDHKTLAQNTVGLDVTVTTYNVGNGTYETSVEGGELDGHLFPSYSEPEALRMHELILRDEENVQRTSAIIGSNQEGTPLDKFELNPEWTFVFGYSPKFLKNEPGNMNISYSVPQMVNTLKAAGAQHHAQVIAGKVGKVFGQTWVYETLSPVDDKVASKIEKILGEKFGGHFLPYGKLEESVQNGDIPTFLLPSHGCFGFLNGHLIIGSRHHQEIMYRLLEKGWTWDDLMNAKQAWGWFTHHAGNISINFSSDAGIIDGPTKTLCMAKFGSMFHVGNVQDNGGYGGKSKKTYGGNFDIKYGDPTNQKVDKMDGYKTKYDSTIISPLPDPPNKENVVTKVLDAILPGGGKAPPKKKVADTISLRGPGVQYHGLHDPVVLRHVWQNHDWFESQVPHVDDAPDPGDNDDVTTMSEHVGPEVVAA